jgi:hypothetical protein
VHCLAGFGKHTSWYRNALAHPVASAFASRAFEGIGARRIDDDTLRELAERFPPMRITIAGPAAGRRAGDLAGAWVPIAAGALAICARRTCRPS